jgi:hypothetical protein
MIGVAVQPDERVIAQEFFELCKTCWEFFRPGQRYDVLVSTCGLPPSSERPKLLVVFGGGLADTDSAITDARFWPGGGILQFSGECIPIYGALSTFPASEIDFVREVSSHEAAIETAQLGEILSVSVGYNLFAETLYSLTKGQPVTHAAIPTLELHIALLRDIVTRAGIPFVEIPPAPVSHAFIACLTHDVDHPILRNHFCDHTMFGFLYRATVGSAVNWCRGRRGLVEVVINWWAAARLPFVCAGLANDFWRTFDNYVEIEAERPSTFFFIPEPHVAGDTPDGPAPEKRASRYTPAELTPQLRRIRSTGNEIGLHGIDAWRHVDGACREHTVLTAVAGEPVRGIRMHWLYFGPSAPAILDTAGFAYDSSVGFNTSVGYRAGTTQAYRFPGTKTLIELPLHIMDTALFYPDYMDLCESSAGDLVRKMAGNSERLGGVLTINWHDRSIAAERLWGEFYLGLLRDLEKRGAWFATAAGAVTWFEKRRAATIECRWHQPDAILLRASTSGADSLPDLKVRVYRPRARSTSASLTADSPVSFTEVKLNRVVETSIAI